MRHIAVYTAVAASLAFAGCSTITPQLEQVGGSFIAAGIQKVEADPSLVPCLASQAALVAAGLLGPKGSAIRKTNRQTVRVSRNLCQRLGGQETTQTAAAGTK